MQKWFFLLFIFASTSFAQQSDFNHIDFSKADKIAKSYKSKGMLDLHKTTYALTKNLTTDVEKLRAIYIWICHNIANDYNLFTQNSRKRRRFKNDSIRLHKWNSRFKKILFKKLLKRKKTICTGYAYLLKEMSDIAGVEVKTVNGFGRTSEVNVEFLTEPNHSWNVVKLNDKWYLCDPTWATGISYPEENKFVFTYNDGYFLTDPKLFLLNHFPLDFNYALIKNKKISIKEYSEMPLLYAEAYNVLKELITPPKMHHEIVKNETFTFKYQLKKEIDISKINFVISNGFSEKTVHPKIELNNKIITLKNTFTTRGFYDVHLYINKKIIATYTFKVIKQSLK